jgi:hypothetical protein
MGFGDALVPLAMIVSADVEFGMAFTVVPANDLIRLKPGFRVWLA